MTLGSSKKGRRERTRNNYREIRRSNTKCSNKGSNKRPLGRKKKRNRSQKNIWFTFVNAVAKSSIRRTNL
jgi:hypothetical protein